MTDTTTSNGRGQNGGLDDRADEKTGKLHFADADTDAAKKTLRTALPQVLATSAKNILLLAYGMTLGFPTIVIPALSAASRGDGVHDVISLDRDQISWFSSINLVCVPVGCLASGALTAPLGRRKAMMIVNLPFIAAWLMFHFADRVSMLYASLVLTGLAGGLLEAPVLTYVAEISQPHLRGMLSATSSMSVILGVFIQFLLGSLLPWRTVAAVNLAFPLAALTALCFVPESPYWLVGKQRVAEAERSLRWLRGWVSASEVRAELAFIVGSVQPSASGVATPTPSSGKPAWRHYAHRTFLRPYLLVSAAFFIGHFAGVTTLQTFAVTIFKELGTPTDAYVATLYLGLVELAGSLLCVILVHWTGKRPLTFVSTAGNGLCFAVVATYAHLATRPGADVAAFAWAPMTFLLLAAFLSHISIRLLPWILIGEVFPQRVRNVSAGASSSIGYIFGFLANKAYVYMVDGMTLAGTFYLYAVVSLLGGAFLYWYMPETEGRTLAEIEQHFEGHVDLRHTGRARPEKEPEDTRL